MAIVGFILCKERLLQLLLRINNYLIIDYWISKRLCSFFQNFESIPSLSIPRHLCYYYGEFSDERSFQGWVFFLFFEIRISFHFYKGKSVAYSYSRTSRKRPPKMQRLSGRLREVVVVYKNRTTGVLFQEEVQTHLLYGRLFIACDI